MKKVTFILLILFSFETFGQGVIFNEMSIDSIINKAKNENKYVFLLYGINQCGYARKSYNELMTDSTISDYMNENFINVILADSFNEREFIALLAIMDAPRYFFISPDGEIVMMRSNYHRPKKVKRYGERVLKGRIIRPNLFMYTGKMYGKNRATLSMLTHTMNAYLKLRRHGFALTDGTTHSGLVLSRSEFDYINNEINKSFEYGEYPTNKFINELNLVYNVDN